MKTTLHTIFNEIQACDSKQFSENISNALGLIPADNSFLEIINVLLLCQKNTIPPKVSHFIGRIFEELGQSKPVILQSVLLHISSKLSCKATKVRRNSLKLISTILSINESTISDDLIQRITERLFDKEQSVRKEALKICLIFQNMHLTETLKVQGTLKDVIRYDQSNEIRRLGLLGLEVNSTTINCILERCIDTSSHIRKLFWMVCFPKIDLSQVPKFQRIYLMKKAFAEREFDVKEIFVQRLRDTGLEDFIEHFYCEEPEYNKCIEMYLQNETKEYELNKYTPSYLHFLFVYYKYKEDTDGRDSLKLVDLEEYLKILYIKCNDLEALVQKKEAQDKIQPSTKSVKYLFKLLVFYDIFTDESKKYILSIITNLIIKSNGTEIVEKSVILAKRICGTRMVNFLGSIIKKTKGTPICYVVCEHIMKHVPFDKMHEAILTEIAMMDINQSLNIFYWYFVNNPSEHIEHLYLSFLPNKKAIEGATDFVLMNLVDTSKIYGCIYTQLSKFNENVVIPASKLLLVGKIDNSEFIKHLLTIFYTSGTDYIQQYLSLFFYEFFRSDSSKLIDVYCSVLEMISSNQRTFVDQSLFWVSSSDLKNGSQQLFFRVCLYILNNYDSLVNKKYLFGTLDKIAILPVWDGILTKKIISLIGLIIKKRPRENVNAYLSRLIEIDDGIPLSSGNYEELKHLVVN